MYKVTLADNKFLRLLATSPLKNEYICGHSVSLDISISGHSGIV